ncbi:MAG: pyridoxal phosphate-dependent aminotransferase [Deferribacterales bacterium]
MSDQLDKNLNLNVRGLSLSATLAINELSNSMIKQGKKVYKLGLGQSPFPVPQPVVDELKNNAFQKDYLPVRGLPALQSSIADFYRKTQGLQFTPSSILIGPGSKELMFILQLVYYGDLLIPSPSWVSYAPQAHIIGRHVSWIDTKEENGWLLTPEELDEYCSADSGKPRILILNYPNNPTGNTYNAAELRELADVARKHKILLLSDEIYGETNHEGDHVSIARYYPEGTIISSGLSKWCGAGGWRLGVFAFPDKLSWLMDAMASVASETYTSTSAPIQYAAVRAFHLGLDIERYLVNSRKVLKSLGLHLYKLMTDAGVSLCRPVGGFYMFPNFEKFRAQLANKGITTSIQLCERLLAETGVAVLPGASFGRDKNELTARLAYVDFDGARALAAVESMPKDYMPDEKFLKTYCLNNVEAIEKMTEWLKAL